jgi:hypothetical protein
MRAGACVSRETLSKIASVLFWLALAITLVMATLPSPPKMHMQVGDKLTHMSAFAALSLFAWLAFPKRGVVWLFAVMAMLGAVIEVLQLIPALQRDADVADWIADCGASLAVLVICQTMRWIVSRRSRRIQGS